MPTPLLFRTAAAALALLALASCVQGTPPAAPAAGLWRLTAIEGRPFTGTATLDLTQPGTFSGQAPCNRFSGRSTGQGTRLILTDLVATEMACAALADETRFFQVLGRVTTADVGADGALRLTAPTGQSLTFAPISG